MNKNVIFSIMFTSMFILLAHNIVPHHHHNHSAAMHKEKGCHTNLQEHNNKHEHKHNDDKDTNIPFHCHAFNDADWFKQDQIYKLTVTEAFLLIAFNFQYCKSEKHNLLFIRREIPKLNRDYYHFHSTRPPPTKIG